MKTPTRWDWVWGAYTAAGIGIFAVLETIALRKRSLPTYSRTLARWAGCHPRTRRGHITPVAFVAFAAWLAVHVARYRVPDA